VLKENILSLTRIFKRQLFFLAKGEKMKVKLIRYGSLISLYNGIYAVAYGILIFIFDKILIAEYFRNSPVKWFFFSKTFPYNAKLYSYLLMINAFFIISLGIFIIYLSYFILKRKDKLAWVILFGSGILSWAGLFIMNILLKNWILIGLSFIGWASFAVGMILPIRYYVKKEYPGF